MSQQETHGVAYFTDANFQEEVVQSKVPVIVDFWAEWCGPCHMLTPTIEELATELAGKVKVGKVNIDENPQTAAAYGIRSIPTVLLFRDGQVVESLIGVQPKQRYLEAVEKV